MKKLLSWCKDNILFLFTLFLLAFIPLYPKLPLIDIKHVWVYVRVEDFVVLFMLLVWVGIAIRKNLSFRTPLTQPILIFWLIGAVATIHGVLLIFPTLAHVFPNVALLSLVRRIEYMSLFFIAYYAVREKKQLSLVVIVLTLTLLAVSLYGIGQRYFSLPAYLTMNEEFAKGVPLTLSALSRVSSTFAGHYDLAAYFVLIIPIIVSLLFGYRNWLIKLILLGSACLAFLVLFLTVSRISVFALFIALGVVLLVQKRRFLFLSIPVVGIVVASLLYYSPSLLDRFGSTVKDIDVIVDAKTGAPIGHIREVPQTYFQNKTVKQEYFLNVEMVKTASPSMTQVVPYRLIPDPVVLLGEPQAPTGENLPQGTGYINLSLSPVIRRIGQFYYEYKPTPDAAETKVTIINGDYLHKKVAAYDLSFTTRFQAEWPHAIAAFKRNIFFGSGYGSVSLAVDNSYLRMLGEVGVLGFASFVAIFIVIGLYIKKALPTIDSAPVKSFVVGLSAGIIGLAVNAIFIDVFEASKVAFVLWLLVGVALAIARLYQHVPFQFYKELKKAATSSAAIIIYLGVLTMLLFSAMTRNYFVGDDFTWFRWVAQDANVLEYFTSAKGFFYRPGAKLYFLSMYSFFWLNQAAYHAVSLLLHFVTSALVFLLAGKVFKHRMLAALTAVLFLLVSGYSEAVFWISATGFLFTSVFSLAGVLCYIEWTERKNVVLGVAAFLFTIVSALFHELGVVTPLLFVLYQLTIARKMNVKDMLGDIYHWLFFLPIPLYLLVRFFAGSHWFSGDYNYNILKLPFNAVGNAIGYAGLSLFGSLAMPMYQLLRTGMRANVAIAAVVALIVVGIGIAVYKKFFKAMKKQEARILLFGAGFSVIALLPFLGLGNIASRYGYFASIGILMLFVYAISALYTYIVRHGRDIALIVCALVVSLFSLVHMVQLHQANSDWYEAGEKIKRFLVSMESHYDDKLAVTPLELHFVHVPIRHGDAWIFPVGLPDLLWLVFRNPNTRVYIWSTPEQALAAVEYESETQRIFVFDDQGTVTQIKKKRGTQ